jgi:hypothetical protein
MSKQKLKWQVLTALSLFLSMAIAPKATAQDYMGMFMDANQAAVSFAGNLAVGSAVLNSIHGNNAANSPNPGTRSSQLLMGNKCK